MEAWVKGKPRASWHLLQTWTRVPGRVITCERCFQLREMRV